MNIKTSARYLAALIPFISNHECRHYLNGIQIAPAAAGGIILAATNGHTIGVIHDPEGSADAETILDMSESSLLRSVLADGFREVTSMDYEEGYQTTSMSGDFGSVRIEGDLSTVFGPQDKYITHKIGVEGIDGPFPQWQTIFFKADALNKPQNYAALNPQLLMHIGTAVKILENTTVPHIKVFFTSVDKDGSGEFDGPMIVTTRNDKFRAAIMPVKGGGMKDHTIPEWITP
jgi:hypothetical protein